jgi:hypothetical protein
VQQVGDDELIHGRAGKRVRRALIPSLAFKVISLGANATGVNGTGVKGHRASRIGTQVALELGVT